MDRIAIGSTIRIKPGILWKGIDIGEMKATVISTTSYIMVRIQTFDKLLQEPIKLMRTEIEEIVRPAIEPTLDDYIEEAAFPGNLFDDVDP